MGRQILFLEAAYYLTSKYRVTQYVPTTISLIYRSVGIWPIYGAGWHCSWCFSPEGIRKKLLDAPKSDYPRFGDDVAKTTVDYIKRLIKHGQLS